ncbi:MAG: type II CAAX endopeptidase family protein [Clostridium perfringens]|nr:type II CAAX endopeptidase family protein [Clostridium perfringens]
MNFFSKLNIYKRMNEGQINICRLSVIGIVLIILFNDYLSAILNIIVIKSLLTLNILSIQSAQYALVRFLIEFITTTISLGTICGILVAINKYSKKTYSNLDTPRAVKLKYGYYYGALVIIGFRVFFEGSVSHVTKLIPMPENISNAFEAMSLSPIYLLLTVCIFAPFIEEFVYRGLFLNGLLKMHPKHPYFAIFLSALIFAIAHRNIPQGINAFLLGLFLGTVYYKTHSLYLSIFMHFINNLCAQFMGLLSLGTVSIIVQSIIYTILGLYLIYRGLRGLDVII